MAMISEVERGEIERAFAALVVDYGVLSADLGVAAIRESRATGRPLVDILAAQVPEADLLKPIAAELGLRFYDLHARDQEFTESDEILRRCDPQILIEHSAMPLVDHSGRVVVALANPNDVDIVRYLRGKYPDGFVVALVPKAQIQARLLYLASAFDSEKAATGPHAVPDWVDYVLARAVAEGGSDIHFRYHHDGTLFVRLRVDGILRPIPFPLKGREREVVGTFLAKCSTVDSANLFEPQDGAFSFTAAGRNIDARVAVIPQITGSNMTVRILDSANIRKRLEEMGFDSTHLGTMRDSVSRSQGCVIVVGPTGSGKTTTLYSLLREVDAASRNVLTVEDPVEYRLPYVGQTQIRAGLGERSLTFARALRSILRHDPDVVLVGEIRDLETARTAMEASVTGHLVLTTLHAHDAPGAYVRLTEMGLPNYLVADALTLVVSQRLVRRVHECAQMGPPTQIERDLLERWGVTDIPLVPHPVGCPGCAGAGFRGRLAVAEVLTPTAQIRNAISVRATKDELRAAARAAGWQPIVEDGLRHVRAGQTTVTELSRILSADADFTEIEAS